MGDIEITFLMNPHVLTALGVWLLATLVKYVVGFFRG